MTEFEKVYNCFYSKITDDMYMELDANQTAELMKELLLNALQWFEFPRTNIYDYDLELEVFNPNLNYEEVNIIATYMIVEWINQQLASIELIRMKYSGSDFKFTSQANHLSKLLALKKEYERVGFHLQRLYKRRKTDKNGAIRSTLGSIMATSVRRGGVSYNKIDSSNGGGAVPDLDDSNNGSWEDIETPDNGNDDLWEDMS